MTDIEIIAQPMPSPRYSTLELTKYDATAAAPERDHAITAPENGRQRVALEVAAELGPELFYSNSPPEAVSNFEKPFVSSSDSSMGSQGLSARAKIIITTVIATLVVGLAVGIGVGIGVARQRCGGNSSLGTSGTTTPSTSPSASITTILSNRKILDDTSIAALTFPNEDRRLFFQDFMAVIRQAFYSSSSKQWRSDVGCVVASNAKNHNPIAAINPPTAIANKIGKSSTILYPSMSVFYSAATNKIACVIFDQGTWHSPLESLSSGYFTDMAYFTATADFRHLLVETGSAEEGFLKAWLIYESIDPGLALFSGTFSDMLGSLHSNGSAWHHPG